MNKLAVFGLVLLVLGCGYNSKELGYGEAERESFDGLKLEAKDGKTVYASLVKTDRVRQGVILLFHQAGSNMHEYDPIVPELSNRGWDSLTVDLRSGGESWDEINLTMSQFDKNQGFLDAYADMEAALEWAEGGDYNKVIVCGSSYSASLVLKLAAENKSVDGVMCFSPGEYQGLYPDGVKPEDGFLVASWNANVNVPVLFAGTGDERESLYVIEGSAPNTPERDRDILHTSGKGVHGSSALRQDKNPEGYLWYMSAVDRFLKDVASDGKAFGG